MTLSKQTHVTQISDRQFKSARSWPSLSIATYSKDNHSLREIKRLVVTDDLGDSEKQFFKVFFADLKVEFFFCLSRRASTKKMYTLTVMVSSGAASKKYRDLLKIAVKNLCEQIYPNHDADWHAADLDFEWTRLSKQFTKYLQKHEIVKLKNDSAGSLILNIDFDSLKINKNKSFSEKLKVIILARPRRKRKSPVFPKVGSFNIYTASEKKEDSKIGGEKVLKSRFGDKVPTEFGLLDIKALPSIIQTSSQTRKPVS